MIIRSARDDVRLPSRICSTRLPRVLCVFLAVFLVVVSATSPFVPVAFCGDKAARQDQGKGQKIQRVAERYIAEKEPAASEIVSVRHITSVNGIKLILELSRPVEFQRHTLSNPERVYFDLKNARLPKDLSASVPPVEGLLKRVRMAQNAGGVVRIVFDLDGPDYVVKTSQLNSPPRMIIDLLFKDAKGDIVEETTVVKSDPPHIRKRIVIDPGHGGEDPGAIGPRGTQEKDIVLDVALRVRDIFKKEAGSFEVILTRDTDIFIPLEGRAEIANKANADLFVSIHANASVNRQARGIETYLLNWTNDAEALKVAARENKISLKKMEQVQNELSVILASLERESKRDESVKLAGFIQNALVERLNSPYHRGPYNGVKQALFYVLVGAHMPSALVEVSFISNREEEKLLNTPSYRQKIAESIVEGIKKFFETSHPLRTAQLRKAQGSKGQSSRLAASTHSN